MYFGQDQGPSHQSRYPLVTCAHVRCSKTDAVDADALARAPGALSDRTLRDPPGREAPTLTSVINAQHVAGRISKICFPPEPDLIRRLALKLEALAL